MDSTTIILVISMLTMLFWVPIFIWILYIHITINQIDKDVDDLCNSSLEQYNYINKQLNNINTKICDMKDLTFYNKKCNKPKNGRKI